MDGREKSLLKAALLALLPVALVFPVLALTHFGPCGPARAWPILLYAPLAIWMQTRAVSHLLGMYRRVLDPLAFAVLPLGFVSLSNYALSGFLLILALPAVFHHFI